MTIAKKVSIIGGGIQGLCTAYYLNKEGLEVSVFEPKTAETGASYVNAGYLTPSHIIPLAAPGMVRKGLKWMLKSNSPFYVKPRLNKAFLKWSWQFYKSSTQEKVSAAIPVIKDINLLSEECFKEIKSSGALGNFQLDHHGLLMLYKTKKAGAAESDVAEKAAHLSLKVSRPKTKELNDLQPNLSQDILGSILYECDSHTTPTEIMPKLKDHLIRAGVVFINEEVCDFEHLEGVVQTLITNKNKYPIEELVIAAGTWSAKLAKKLNITLSLEAGKGYRIDVHRETGIKIPAILMEAKVAVTPMKGFTRFAGTMELSGINTQIRKERVNAIAKAAESYYTGLKITAAEKEAAASGMRPVSPDGLPYIGRPKAIKNLCFATGHAMMGWSLGPATGKLISEIILNKKTSMDLSAFDPDRKF